MIIRDKNVILFTVKVGVTTVSQAEDVLVMICSNESGWMILDDDDDVLEHP